MPRGVYPRKPKTARLADKLTSVEMTAPVVVETDDEISARIAERFEVLEYMTDASISGEVRSLIVSGPAGLGKSHTVETKLQAWDPDAARHTQVKGYVRAPSLFKLLYAHRYPGMVLVFDDADDVFLDEVSIGLLKAVCDSSDRRVVHYMTEATLIDDTGEVLPKSFQFDGTIIFITNQDFDAAIERGSKLAPHMEALVSRSHYIDLAMKSRRDYMVRIRQVIAQGLLADRGLDETGQADVMDFITANSDRLRELSLRMAIKVANIRRKGGDNWQKVARITCCRTA
jgi:hypothetical protein